MLMGASRLKLAFSLCMNVWDVRLRISRVDKSRFDRVFVVIWFYLNIFVGMRADVSVVLTGGAEKSRSR